MKKVISSVFLLVCISGCEDHVETQTPWGTLTSSSFSLINQDNAVRNPTWSKQLDVIDGSAYPSGVAVDGEGNSIVVGYTDSALPGLTQVGRHDYTIVKYDTSGTVQWSQQVGSDGALSHARAVAVDTNGDIVVVGDTSASLFRQKQEGKVDSFVAKYNKAGMVIWYKQFGNKLGSTFSYGVDIDPDGNIIMVGSTSVGLFGKSQAGIFDYFIVTSDASGSLIKADQFGYTNGTSRARAVTIDKQGIATVVGATNVGLFGQAQNGVQDYFVAQYRPSGKLAWYRQSGSDFGFASALDVDSDDKGDIVLAGSTSSALSDQSQKGEQDYFVAKYDMTGHMVWLKQEGFKNGLTSAVGVVADDDGYSTIVGNAKLQNTGKQQQQNNAFFVAHFNSTGERVELENVRAQNTATNARAVDRNRKTGLYAIVGDTSAIAFDQSPLGMPESFIAIYELSPP